MANYRIIKKRENYYPEIRKKLFWHSLKEEDGNSKKSFSSYEEAKEFVLNTIKQETKDK